MKAIYLVTLALISIIAGIIAYAIYPAITADIVESNLTCINETFENNEDITESSVLDLHNTIKLKSDNGIVYLNANDISVRNGRTLIRFNSTLFQSLGIQLIYDSVQSKFTANYFDSQGNAHTVTNYIKDLEWYRDGLNVYLADCRSEEYFIPLRALLVACGYTVTTDIEDNTIYVKRA